MSGVSGLPVVVVGAGVAGVACARALADRGVPAELRERSSVPGGRMASRTLRGRKVDLGSSYLTSRDPDFQQVVDGWVDRGLAHPWTDRFAVRTATGWAPGPVGPQRYGAAGGLRSLVEDLAVGLVVRTGVEVADVGPGPTVDGEPARAVVLAMPDPQASDLLADELTAEVAAVAGRESLPALTLAAGWPERLWRDVDGVFRPRRPRPRLGRRRRPPPRGRRSGARRAHDGRVRRPAPGPAAGGDRGSVGRAAAGDADRPAAGMDVPAPLVAGPPGAAARRRLTTSATRWSACAATGGGRRGWRPPGRPAGHSAPRWRSGSDERPSAGRGTRPGPAPGGRLVPADLAVRDGQSSRTATPGRGPSPPPSISCSPPGRRPAGTGSARRELWLWQGLGPLRLRFGGSGPAPAEESAAVVGPEPGAGHALQALVPAGTWQAAEPLSGAGSLVACVVAPGFEFADFELAD